MWSPPSASELLSIPSSLPHTRVWNLIGEWDFRSKGEVFSFCPSRDEGPLAGAQDRAVCLPVPLHNTRHQAFSHTFEYISAWPLPPTAWSDAQKIVMLGTSAYTSPFTYLGLSGDLQIPELPTDKGLGSLLTPQEVCLGVWISPGRLCAPHLCFCLSLPVTLNAHFKDKNSLVCSVLPLTRQVDWISR